MKDYFKEFISVHSDGADRRRIQRNTIPQELTKPTKPPAVPPEKGFVGFVSNQGVGYPEKIEGQRHHYALENKSVLGVAVEEPCLVGCGSKVQFYYQDGTGYGYCARCDVHQRIVPQTI